MLRRCHVHAIIESIIMFKWMLGGSIIKPKKTKERTVLFRFHFNSFLFQLIFRMLAIILLLTGIFSLLVVYSEADNTQKQMDTSYLNMLNSSANSVDLTLESLCQQIRQVAVNAYCVNAMVVPGTDNYERTQNVITLLSNTVSGTKLVSAALLYIPTDEMLYTSFGSFLPADEFAYSKWIEDYQADDGLQATFLSGSYYTDVFLNDSGMMLCQSFLPQNFNPIGVVIFRVDQEYFRQRFLVDAHQNDRSRLHIYSSDGVPLMYGDEALLLTDSVLQQIQDSGLASGYESYTDGENGTVYAYYYKSDTTGWIYCYTVTGRTLRTALALGERPWLLPLISILALVAVVYIAFKCYSPIRRLAYAASAALAQSDKPESVQVKNEMELIGQAFSASREKNVRLSQSLQSMRDDVLERLFSGMIMGHNISEERIREVLTSLEEPYNLESPMMVLGVAIEKELEHEVSEPEMIRLLLALREHLSGQEFSCCVMRGPESGFIVPLFFMEDTDADSIRGTIQKLVHSIPVLLRTFDCTFYTAYSSIYHHINDLSYACMEMQDFLKQKLFYGKNPQQVLEFPDISSNTSERIKQILYCIDEGNFDKAIEIIRRVAPEIAAASTGAEEAGRQYDLFSRSLLDKLMVVRLVNIDSLIAEKAKLQRTFRESRDLSYMEERFRDSLTDIFRELQQRNKTKKYQNIIRATEYIEANYVDCDLSLNRTAAYVGITPSYLSRIFREELGLAFVDYLRDIRIEKCKYYLTTTDIPITSIGYQTGFSSMQSFFRTFKKIMGMPPGAYRQQNRQ